MADSTFDVSKTPQPYDIKDALSSLTETKTNITDFLAQQEANYANIEGIITEQADKASASIDEFRTQINEFVLNKEDINIDINSIIEPYRNAVNNQIATLQNAYQSQVAVQAKQLDAAVGAGAFGGNSLRARQAYQTASTNLFNQSIAQIADIAINSEQNIMETVAGLQEARIRANESETNIVGLYGTLAKLTVEAGNILTSNWLGLEQTRSDTALKALSMLGNLNLKEAEIKQTLARDIFSAEMEQINNNVKLQMAYWSAAATEFSAIQQSLAARRQAQANEYIASVNAEAAIQIAEIQSQTALATENIGQQVVSDWINAFGNTSTSSEFAGYSFITPEGISSYNPNTSYGII